MKAKAKLLAFLITAAAWLALSSCTLTIHPDGSRTYGIDGEQAARAIYSAK